MWVHCNAVLENSHMKELVGYAEEIRVPYSFDFADVSSFRAALNDDGTRDGNTLVFLVTGQVECVDVEYEEMREILKEYELQRSANTVN